LNIATGNFQISGNNRLRSGTADTVDSESWYLNWNAAIDSGMTTAWTISGGNAARLSVSRITVAPSCVAAMVFKLPSKVPIAVRRGEQIKTSVPMIYLL
jgi:hypothetical protein